MSIRQARIWYLHHSGFLVETEIIILFLIILRMNLPEVTEALTMGLFLKAAG